MGQMTIVSILNDGWSTIKENPDQFLKNIEDGMNNHINGKHVHAYPVGHYANPMEVHTTFHSNMTKIVAVGGNHMENLTDIDENRDDDFYLAYKLGLAQKAQDAVETAKSNVANALAQVIVKDMQALHKTVDDILEIAKNYETYRMMSDEERAKIIWLVGCQISKDEKK